MKFWNIALFMFLLQISIGVINAIGLTNIQYQQQEDWIDTVNNDNLSDESYVQSQLEDTSFGFGDFISLIKGIWYFISTVGLAIVSVPYTLGIFGMHAPFTYYFSAPIYFIYVIALAQFIRGVGTKSMD